MRVHIHERGKSSKSVAVYRLIRVISNVLRYPLDNAVDDVYIAFFSEYNDIFNK